jgi:hypothetical protein
VRRDHPTGGVVDADEAILLLLDHRRHRGPVDQRLHLADRRFQGAVNDLERDRIERARCRIPRYRLFECHNEPLTPM